MCDKGTSMNHRAILLLTRRSSRKALELYITTVCLNTAKYKCVFLLQQRPAIAALTRFTFVVYICPLHYESPPILSAQCDLEKESPCGLEWRTMLINQVMENVILPESDVMCRPVFQLNLNKTTRRCQYHKQLHVFHQTCCNRGIW